jgi:hypothetical protein
MGAINENPKKMKGIHCCLPQSHLIRKDAAKVTFSLHSCDAIIHEPDAFPLMGPHVAAYIRVNDHRHDSLAIL